MRIYAQLGLSLAVMALLVGCGFGNASFSGDFSERAFHPEGTTFGYVDSLEAAPELRGREHPRVVAALTFAAFDPAVDQERLSGREINDLKHAIEISDWVSLWWKQRDQVSQGSQYTDVLLVGGQDGRYDDSDSTASGRSDDFRARFGIAREPLAPGASYSDFRPFGTRAVVTVHLSEVDLGDGGRLAGKLTLKIERVDSDPANARTGTVEGEFSAPLLGERIAEKNMETLGLYGLLEVRR